MLFALIDCRFVHSTSAKKVFLKVSLEIISIGIDISKRLDQRLRQYICLERYIMNFLCVSMEDLLISFQLPGIMYQDVEV